MSERSEMVVRRFYEELWNEWRLELIEELLSPELRFRGSLGTTCVGHDEFRRYAETIRSAFPDWHNRVDESLSRDERVATRITWTGTHRQEFAGIAATGAQVEYVGAAFFRLEAGRIADGWVVGDTQALWRSLGVGRAGPAAPTA